MDWAGGWSKRSGCCFHSFFFLWSYLKGSRPAVMKHHSLTQRVLVSSVWDVSLLATPACFSRQNCGTVVPFCALLKVFGQSKLNFLLHFQQKLCQPEGSPLSEKLSCKGKCLYGHLLAGRGGEQQPLFLPLPQTGQCAVRGRGGGLCPAVLPALGGVWAWAWTSLLHSTFKSPTPTIHVLVPHIGSTSLTPPSKPVPFPSLGKGEAFLHYSSPPGLGGVELSAPHAFPRLITSREQGRGGRCRLNGCAVPSPGMVSNRGNYWKILLTRT